MSNKKVFTFAGKEIDVNWDGRLCIHIAECGQAEGELFVGGRAPWCMPDVTSKQEVAEVCLRCPSGALTYEDKAGSKEQAAEFNTAQVAYNGPLFVQGDLAIEGVPEDMPGVRFRAALCRCGHSENKPFCDNSHLNAGFDDYGAVGQQGSSGSARGGKLNIKPVPNGPLVVSGNLSILASSGRTAWEGDQTALCRCGASNNKPFCDGSHKAVDFKSE